MSPLLFNYYLNDLATRLALTPHTKLYFYADDIAVLTSGKQRMKKSVREIESWFKLNDMVLNYSKCGVKSHNKR